MERFDVHEAVRIDANDFASIVLAKVMLRVRGGGELEEIAF